jgi:uncharacterized protein
MADDRWQVLSGNECRALLASTHLGRIALVRSGRPLILPVNFVLDEAAVVFRTDEGSKLDAALQGAEVAFEADGVDKHPQTGWSVVVRGRAEHVTDRVDLERLRRLPLVPWAPGAKASYVRIQPDETTGRRIGVADLPHDWWG